MDYSQFQVKYVDTKLPTSRLLEIPEGEMQDIPSYRNISYLNGEAQPATALIQKEEEVQNIQNPVKKVINTTPTFKTSKGLNQFNFNYNEALKVGGTEAAQLQSRRALFTHLAQMESGFNSTIQNRAGAPAYGYFQFMQGNYKGRNYNNVGLFGGVDLNTFRNSPVIQIRAANKLANAFMSSFSKTELNRLHNMGWTDNAIIAGCWAGGPGGVKAYAFRNQDRSDGATTVGTRMKLFNY